MADLVEWLTQVLDEDERLATKATAGPWRHDPRKHWRKPGTAWFEEAVFAGPAGKDAECIAGTGESDDPQSIYDAAHIARHDPAAVLADIAAKRAIIARHAAVRVSGDTRCAVCIKPEWPCATLHDMATAYADRPGYHFNGWQS